MTLPTYPVTVLDRAASLQIVQAIARQDGTARAACLARALGFPITSALYVIAGVGALERHLDKELPL